MVAIFPKLCLWRRSLCSNLGGIGPEKLYRATLPSQFLRENPWGSLRRRRNISPVTNICEAAPISLFWAPNGVNELPEMRFKFSFNLIGKLTMAFFQANHGNVLKSWYRGGKLLFCLLNLLFCSSFRCRLVVGYS